MDVNGMPHSRRRLLLVLCLFASVVRDAHAQSQTAQIVAQQESCGHPHCGLAGRGEDGDDASTTPVAIRTPEPESRSNGESAGARSDAGQNKRAVDSKHSPEDSLREGAGPAVAEEPTEFERFVEDATGTRLHPFGQELFRSRASTFAPAGSLVAPSDYLLGPGDEIAVRAWGKIEVDARLTVDRNGQIFLPRVGALTVAGLRYGDLPKFIHAAIGRQFRDFDSTVTLGQLRSIQVFVLGHARQPGVYTIGALSTLVNALFVSGGPSTTGTMRDIQVKRDGRIVTHLDLYRFLLHGDKSGDTPLLAGDILFIPEAGSRAAIAGDVNTPAIFELQPQDTIGSMLDDAGGLTALAASARVVVERIEGHTTRHLREFALDAAGLQTKLADGDIVRIDPISPAMDNAVTLRGNVIAPGLYAWHAGMRVTDLIPSRESLLTRAYFNRQNALEATGDRSFGVAASEPDAKGAAAARSTPPLLPGASQHETEIDWNHASIERLNRTNLTLDMIPFALAEAVAQPTSKANLALEPGDVIVIYSRHEIPLPDELQARFVRIDGQVAAPGIYRVKDGETLRDLVVQAGGFGPHAYLYAAQLTRESVRIEQEVRLHEFVERINREVLSPANESHAGSGDKAGAAAELALRQAYIAKLGEIHPTGRVVLRLQPSASRIDDVPEFAVEDGDHFSVPATPNTIDVLGDVYNQGALRYLPGQRARTYLDAAGGATRDGDEKREFVIRADGTLVSRQAVHGLQQLQLYPGDAVIVPPRLRASWNLFDFTNIAQMVSSFALSALAIKALQ
jgi:polysaccharide export outer membrane protein